MKHNNIHIIEVPGQEKEQKIENLFEEIMVENFTNQVKEKDTQGQKVQRDPNSPH